MSAYTYPNFKTVHELERARKDVPHFMRVYRAERDEPRQCLTDRAAALALSDDAESLACRKPPVPSMPAGVGEILKFWRVELPN